jgi:hypothetical protein
MVLYAVGSIISLPELEFYTRRPTIFWRPGKWAFPSRASLTATIRIVSADPKPSRGKPPASGEF